MFNKKKIQELERKIRDLEYELERRKELIDKNSELTIKNAELTTTLNQAKAQIRKQTEADIYFASAKIMKELENGTKKKELQEQIDCRDRLLLEAQRQQVEMRTHPLEMALRGGALGTLGRGFGF